jgi:hypothetical protein
VGAIRSHEDTEVFVRVLTTETEMYLALTTGVFCEVFPPGRGVLSKVPGAAARIKAMQWFKTIDRRNIPENKDIPIFDDD